MKFFRQLKAEWRAFLDTFKDLAKAINEHSRCANLRHAELLAVIGEVSSAVKFLEQSERATLKRAGHRV